MALSAKSRRLDKFITDWLALHGIDLLRVSLGVIFFWFGILKFFPGLSPAQDLAARTISVISFDLVKPAVSLPVLAAWEVLIGLGLLTGIFMRATLLLLLLQMMGAVMPLFLFPDETWKIIAVSPTLEGQYIIKNMVLITAALVIGATVRGGDLVADPKLAEEYQDRAEKDQAAEKAGRKPRADSSSA